MHYHHGVKGLVIQTFTGELLFSIEDKVYALNKILKHEKVSKTLVLHQQLKNRRNGISLP